MRVYLASSFKLAERVEKVAEILKKRGHEITSEWWTRDFKKEFSTVNKDWYEHWKIREIAKKNFAGVAKADILILVAPSDAPTKFNGANVELGYALALGKPCFSLGKLERSAMYLPVKQCEFLEEILDGETKK